MTDAQTHRTVRQRAVFFFPSSEDGWYSIVVSVPEINHPGMDESEDTYAVWERLLAHDRWLRTHSSILGGEESNESADEKRTTL